MRATYRTNFQMLIGGLPLDRRQSVINIKRDQLLDFVTAHSIANFQLPISNCLAPRRLSRPIQSAIGNRQLEIQNAPNGSSTPSRSNSARGAKATRLLLARFKRPHSADCPVLLQSSHFDP